MPANKEVNKLSVSQYIIDSINYSQEDLESSRQIIAPLKAISAALKNE